MHGAHEPSPSYMRLLLQHPPGFPGPRPVDLEASRPPATRECCRWRHPRKNFRGGLPKHRTKLEDQIFSSILPVHQRGNLGNHLVNEYHERRLMVPGPVLLATQIPRQWTLPRNPPQVGSVNHSVVQYPLLQRIRSALERPMVLRGLIRIRRAPQPPVHGSPLNAGSV